MSAHAVDVDQFYRLWVGTLPEPQRARAYALPHESLNTHGDTGLGAYVTFAPLRDLPTYAARHRTLPAPPERLTYAARVGHLMLGCCGAMADRLADGQHAADPDAVRILGRLYRDTRRVLISADAMNLSPNALRDVRKRWWRARNDEAAALKADALTVELYHQLVTDKTAWLGLCAVQQWVLAGHAEAARAFRSIYELLMLSSQCLDDAHDAEEDARRHGRSIHQALKVTPAILVRAGAHLGWHAAHTAQRHGFDAMAAWLFPHTARLFERPIMGDLPAAQLLGSLLGDQLAALTYARTDPV